MSRELLSYNGFVLNFIDIFTQGRLYKIGLYIRKSQSESDAVSPEKKKILKIKKILKERRPPS